MGKAFITIALSLVFVQVLADSLTRDKIKPAAHIVAEPLLDELRLPNVGPAEYRHDWFGQSRDGDVFKRINAPKPVIGVDADPFDVSMVALGLRVNRS